MENKLAELNSRQEDLTAQIKAKTEEHMKEAQEPVRITKHNESTSQGVEKLEDELKKQHDKKKKLDYEIRQINANLDKHQTKTEEVIKDFKACQEDEKQIEFQKRNQQLYLNDLNNRNNEMQQSNQIILKDITTTKVEKKKIELDIKATKKQYNESFQRFTNNEKETRQLQSQI